MRVDGRAALTPGLPLVCEGRVSLEASARTGCKEQDGLQGKTRDVLHAPPGKSHL
jgi:hypothetical protein